MREPRAPERSLNRVGRQIEAHWRTCRPTMVAELERQGKLREAVYLAQQLTGEALANLVGRGVPYDEAWKLIGGQWAELPHEQGASVPRALDERAGTADPER